MNINIWKRKEKYYYNILRVLMTTFIIRLEAILYILSVNEKLPVPKFRYFGKYMIQLFGYCYVHVSGQRHSDFER